ncbi:MAG TPA: lysozyme inhibitor LprI family protein [Steroidobacteraceae bacterium]|jgi:uncharacterized protein YecT (DUF1311 family)|nr:lysozyme inhibitor LprI family protein [Steroidobacteraceae bacterium]
MRRLAALLVLVSANALAQPESPALEACRSYAEQELKQDGTRAASVVLDRDRTLLVERYGRKLGAQPVASILTGNGAVVFENAPSAELAFICLLANHKRAVFFNWLPRQNVSALRQCTREAELRGQPRPCLEILLRVAEADLTQAYARGFHEAREADVAAGGEKFIAAYRSSNDEWRQYRDAECMRRRDLAPQGVAADDYQLACMVELTRRRGLDMRQGQ